MIDKKCGQGCPLEGTQECFKLLGHDGHHEDSFHLWGEHYVVLDKYQKVAVETLDD